MINFGLFFHLLELSARIKKQIFSTWYGLRLRERPRVLERMKSFSRSNHHQFIHTKTSTGFLTSSLIVYLLRSYITFVCDALMFKIYLV